MGKIKTTAEPTCHTTWAEGPIPDDLREAFNAVYALARVVSSIEAAHVAGQIGPVDDFPRVYDKAMAATERVAPSLLTCDAGRTPTGHNPFWAMLRRARLVGTNGPSRLPSFDWDAHVLMALSNVNGVMKGRNEHVGNCGKRAAIPKNTHKRSTAPGDAENVLVACLLRHQGYRNGFCDNLEPIPLRELQRMAELPSPGTVNAFFNRHFGVGKPKKDGHARYKVECSKKNIGEILRQLTGEALSRESRHEFRDDDFVVDADD